MFHKYYPTSSIKNFQANKSISCYKKLEILSLILRLNINILYSIQKFVKSIEFADYIYFLSFISNQQISNQILNLSGEK